MRRILQFLKMLAQIAHTNAHAIKSVLHWRFVNPLTWEPLFAHITFCSSLFVSKVLSQDGLAMPAEGAGGVVRGSHRVGRPVFQFIPCPVFWSLLLHVDTHPSQALTTEFVQE